MAETDELKGRLYRDRSTVFYLVKRYDLWYDNIQLAKNLGNPEEKMDKLNEREEKYQEIMKKSSDYQKSIDYSDFFKLSYEAHPKVPYIINDIKLKSSEKYGNHLITNKDLKTGDIIAVEPFWSYFGGLSYELENKKCLYEKCSFCLRHNCLSLIPCDGCVDSK